MANSPFEIVVSPNVTDPNRVRRIGHAARLAYETVARESGVNDFMNVPIPTEQGTNMVWRAPVCTEIANVMAGDLVELGVGVERHKLRWEDRHGPVHHFLNHHDYVVFSDGSIADGDWQQFVRWQARLAGNRIFVTNDALANMPQVLAGSRDEVVAQAEQCGISDPRILDIWRNPGEPITASHA